MKVWNSFGSEHSTNLVMIGSFKDTTSAEKAKETIDEIARVVGNNPDGYEGADRYPDDALQALERAKFYPAPKELDQFNYSFNAEVDGDKVVITTNEEEVSAFLKLLISRGARVEVYSAHDYPDTGKGR